MGHSSIPAGIGMTETLVMRGANHPADGVEACPDQDFANLLRGAGARTIDSLAR